MAGNVSETAMGIGVDASGNAYIGGDTASTNFPIVNGYSSTNTSTTSNEVFIAKLDSTGTQLLYSTYLGGSSDTFCVGVTSDLAGNVYLTGFTEASDFPIVGGFQTDVINPVGNAFVARIDTTQTGVASLVYSSYLGGGGNSSGPTEIDNSDGAHP